ncbi:MAG: radical SAM protein [Treponema sp.]|nr:radical SAM protein [Treponema sp.]
MNEFYSNCTQCPRQCKINRTENSTGFCGETNKVRIAVACLHFGEEPLVTVHGGSGTIFFTGCTLRCSFCQNYQISQQGMGTEISKVDFANICLKLQELGAENINLVTGSHFIPALAEYIPYAQESGCKIPFCWNSSAYESVETLKLLKDYVKIWLPDLKTLNSHVAKKLFIAKDYPEVATSAIKYMIENFPLQTTSVTKNGIQKEKITQGVIIRHLFLPGHFEDTAETLEWLKTHADKKTWISLMSQYTPVPFKEDEEKLAQRMKSLSIIENRLVSKEEDYDLQDLIEAYDFENLFYQELSDDTSWLPDFNRKQPFSNELATPIWHWKHGFLN